MTLIKSKERAKELGEVYTPSSLVEEMTNQIEKSYWSLDKTIFESSCGNGNFLTVILEKKIKESKDILGSLKTIYGVDIMKDNIKEARCRMLQVCIDNGLSLEDSEIAVEILKKNIVVGNTLEDKSLFENHMS